MVGRWFYKRKGYYSGMMQRRHETPETASNPEIKHGPTNDCIYVCKYITHILRFSDCLIENLERTPANRKKITLYRFQFDRN